MNILVVSRVSIPAKDRTLPAWEHLRRLGHTVTVEHPSSVPTSQRPDAIISMGVTIMEETFEALKRFPGVPLFAYNWDIYAWVWEPGHEGKKQAYHPMRGKEYDYIRYGELLRRAKEIWVPSACTGRRTTQWYGLKNWHVILSSTPWWDYQVQCDECYGEGVARLPDGEEDHCGTCDGSGKVSGVIDGGYALCTLRHLPDPWDTVFEECCTELGIPFERPDHQLPYAEYQRMVAHCRFLVAHYYEASTGGLTLTEGYYHGKPCLLNDSEWLGARDYMGDRGVYFRCGDRDDFKRKLRKMWENPPKLDVAECRKWVVENYSDQLMVERMLARILHHAQS